MTGDEAPRRHPRRKIRVRRVLAWLAIAAVLAVPIEFVVWKVQAQANTERLCPPLEDDLSADPNRFAMELDDKGRPPDFGPYALWISPAWALEGRKVYISAYHQSNMIGERVMRGGDSWTIEGFGTVSIAWVKPYLAPLFGPDGSAFVCITPEDPAFVADYNRHLLPSPGP
jgi:hypothetical protein